MLVYTLVLPLLITIAGFLFTKKKLSIAETAFTLSPLITWNVMTFMGMVPQSISNLIEIYILSISNFLFFLCRRFLTIPKSAVFAFLILINLLSILFRLYIPSIQE